MTTGLVVGKFAPLHYGHEHLLRTAADTVQELVVVVYDAPDIIRVPLMVRSGWIRAVVPRAIVLAGIDPPPRGVWNKAYTRMHEKFITDLVSPRQITHIFSGEEYGERLARVFNANHVRVEKIHRDSSLSASTLRQNPALYQKYVSEPIYHDLKKYGDMV